MASVTLATSEWIHFFKEAGIPPGPAVNYAVMFVDNRIQKNMLMDLNKEIMNELGITVVGDIIAILKHAKVVHRQDMCKAITESVSSVQSTLQSELRRNANSPATRMIANSLSRDSPPSTPVRRPDTSTSKISVTVSNKMAVKNAQAALDEVSDESSAVPVKRRRVTAEMEGKYIINMPKGTTPRTKKILEQQAAKGIQRTSVFDRLGAETKVDTTTGNKPTGVFSRLGDAMEEEDKALESDDDSSVLQYAGVLKRITKPPGKETAKSGITIKAKATSTKPRLAVSTIKLLGSKTAAAGLTKSTKAASGAKVSITQRLGKSPLPLVAQDSKVTSSRSKAEPAFRITIKRTVGSTKVSSTSESHSAQMDNTGPVSVFKRLGTKKK
ncbi:uncharacterized protein C19orf47 homolog [Rhinatrema bivittatum]|uniref:uncharacterized protein C19orf47 homolog n=1 Tax=Rhinatrema bivittatum TaxID=194408 RepID=UPI00112DD639|nr:uncharacterized protein C19orf47 homolog [Rhinatrema bivittatum]XP_029427387.1 uncharacterized protein C19orf47 homolog [Rhinatrema bivittatum]XP_029427388.1 uncharacterized protein C19orf47 homolog [Rhinatrema bivittatum]